jgi:hypothetical protein
LCKIILRGVAASEASAYSRFWLDSCFESKNRVLYTSRRAAKDYSPQRKLWVTWEMNQPQQGEREVLKQARMSGVKQERDHMSARSQLIPTKIFIH